MKFNLLIVDDEWQARKKHYYELTNEITRRYSSFHIELDFLKRPDRGLLRIMLSQNQYAAVITDAVLNGERDWSEFTIVDVMELMDNHTPIAVVSKRWDDTNAKQIARAWEKSNCRTFLHWRDIERIDGGQIEYAVESVVRMITDQKDLDINMHLDPNEDIRIVHISDVHTKGVEDDRILHMAQGCAGAILSHWEEKSPTFVAFTGDVTEYGAPSQYKLAQVWIDHFFKHLRLGKIPARNLLYVPGNHDVNLCLAAASRITLSKEKNSDVLKMKMDDKVSHSDLINYAYVPFKNFLSEISNRSLLKKGCEDFTLAWIEARYRHLGVLFYGINTAQPPNAFGLPGRTVDVGVLLRLEEEIESIKAANTKLTPLVIGLGHHSPVAEAEDWAVKNLDDFRRFFQGKGATTMFLHGHCHQGILTDDKINKVRIFRSGAPSFSQSNKDRPEDTLRGVNLLTLHRLNHEVTSLDACSFNWLDGVLIPTKECKYKLEKGQFSEVK